MSFFKAKTVLRNNEKQDVRVFKKDVNDLKDAFEALQNFVRETYQLDAAFSIQYEDDENDLITIGCGEDLEEASSQAAESNRVLKLHIVPDAIGVPVYSFTTELQPPEPEPQPNVSAIAVESSQKKADADADAEVEENDEDEEDEDEEEKTASNDEGTTTEEEEEDETDGQDQSEQQPALDPLSQLMKDLAENEKFREEFTNFATTFVVLLKDGVNNSADEALKQSLGAYENVSQHPSIAAAAKKFPDLIARFPMALMILSQLDGDKVEGYINLFAQMSKANGANGGCGFNPMMGMLGPLMGMGFGGPPMHGCPPPFGSFFGMNPHGPPPPHHGPPPHAHAHHHPHHPHHHHGFHGRFSRGRHGKCGGRGQGFCNKSWKNQEKPAEEEQQKLDFDAEILRNDLTFEHRGYAVPDQVIIKTFLIKNTGNKDFPKGSKLKYCGPPFNPLVSGVEFEVPELKCEEESEVSLMVQVPASAEPGLYRSRWRLFLPDGETCFGPVFKCQIQVIDEIPAVQPVAAVKEKKQKKAKKAAAKKMSQNESAEEKKRQSILAQKEKLEKKLSRVEKKLSQVSAKKVKKEKKQKKKAEKVSVASASALLVAEPPALLVNDDLDLDLEHDDDDMDMDLVVAEEKHDDENEKPEQQSSDSAAISPFVEVDDADQDDADADADVPALSSNLQFDNQPPANQAVDGFQYEEQLAQIYGMGFEDVCRIVELLEAHKGDMNKVLNQLM